MDDRQRRIVEDLTGVLRGSVRCDAVTTAIYAADASLYQIRPLGVVFPHDADDVRLLARYASEQNIALVPRGGGTNVSGGSVGAGLIVDFSHAMTRILADDGDTIRVEPGVVLERLNRRLRPSGRYFPPDPATAAVTTIGGMIATNAAGSHSIRVGTCRDHVRSLHAVLVGGESIEAGRESGSDPDDAVKTALCERLTTLLVENSDLIDSKRPHSNRNNCGYHVWDVIRSGRLDLAGLLVGSEGTLGMFSAATLSLSPLPEHRGVTLLLFGSTEAALDAVLNILPLRPSACDLIDRRLLSLAREADAAFESMIAPAAEAALLVEVIGDTADATKRLLDSVVRLVSETSRVAARATTDADPRAVDFLWTLPGKVVPRLTKLKGLTRPLPIVEDVAVPPAAIQEFRLRALKVFQKHQVTATLYAHAGDGQMHFRPFLPPPEAGGPVASLEAIARELYQVAISLGGVVSGEHGDGLARTAFIRTQYGSLYRVFRQIKDVFDPANLLNPGKIISDDPKATVRHLRPIAGETSLTQLNLRWSPRRLADEAIRCNGCGACRSQEAGLRMCPFFRVGPAEEAAPRSKAAAMRLAASGELTTEDFASAEMGRLAALCFNCKQCEQECPSEVDIPHLALEAKAMHVAAEGLTRSEWALSRSFMAGPLGNGLSFAVNRLMANPSARWLLEKSFGVSRFRKLPPYARRPFLSSVPRRCRTLRVSPNGEKAVIYFVDEYANRFDPDLALAFIAVIERQGFSVHVPAGQAPSGISLVSAGDIPAARELAEENVRLLAPYASEGHRIVCSEPSAAVCLKREYPFILDHPEVEIVARQTIEAGAFLAELHAGKRFDTDLKSLPLAIGYHAPCHVRALSPDEPFRGLLALIPELAVHKIDAGCSGMAGTWGLSTSHFRTSLKIGWPLISAMRDDGIACGATECSSCRMQMEQGTPKPTIHPLKLLAWSYAGKMPALPKSTSRLLTT